MTQIKPLGAEFEEYLRDESRSVGSAQTISFPTCEDEIRSVLRKLYPAGTPITVQGSRTGLAEWRSTCRRTRYEPLARMLLPGPSS